MLRDYIFLGGDVKLGLFGWIFEFLGSGFF
jgi:hypothetical protein